MSILSCLILNEITDLDVYTVRFDVLPNRYSVIYGIDTENVNEKEILVLDRKGEVKPKIAKAASKRAQSAGDIEQCFTRFM